MHLLISCLQATLQLSARLIATQVISPERIHRNQDDGRVRLGIAGGARERN